MNFVKIERKAESNRDHQDEVCEFDRQADRQTLDTYISAYVPGGLAFFLTWICTSMCVKILFRIKWIDLSDCCDFKSNGS